MNMISIIQLAIRALAIVLCFPVHESAHAWMADMLGDPTGRERGRISLNPLVHMEMWGTICFLLLGIGYAKPVPVDIRNFKNPKKDFALTALAGPASNLLMAATCFVLLRIIYIVPVFWGAVDILETCLYYAAYINISLAVFNMIPVPPLDGSRLVTAILSDSIYNRFLKYERYSAIVLLGLIYLLNLIGITPVSAVTGIVFNGMARIFGL